MKKPGWVKRKCLSQSRSYYRHTTVCSQNKPLLNLCFLSFLAQSPLDVIWSTIALRLTRLALRSPGWSLRYNLKLMLWLASSTWACKLLLVWSNVDNVNIDWAHWLGPPFSLSLAISLSPPSLLLSLSLRPCLELLYVKCSSIRVHSPKALIVVWQPVYTILQLSDTRGSKPVKKELTLNRFKL